LFASIEKALVKKKNIKPEKRLLENSTACSGAETFLKRGRGRKYKYKFRFAPNFQASASIKIVQ